MTGDQFFGKLPTALRDTSLPTAAKLVYPVLWSLQYEKRFRPSIRELSRYCGCKVRHMQYCIKKLEELGFLKVQRFRREESRYFCLRPDLSAAAEKKELAARVHQVQGVPKSRGRSKPKHAPEARRPASAARTSGVKAPRAGKAGPSKPRGPWAWRPGPGPAARWGWQRSSVRG